MGIFDKPLDISFNRRRDELRSQGRRIYSYQKLKKKYLGGEGYEPKLLRFKQDVRGDFRRTDLLKILSKDGGENVHCECRCGIQLILPPFEVVWRQAAKVGCGSLSCTESPVQELIWLHPYTSIDLQARMILASRPHEVTCEWGGFYEDAPDVYFSQGVAKFAADVVKKLPWQSFKRWMHKISPLQPWSLENITFKDTPCLEIKTFFEQDIQTDSEPLSVPMLVDAGKGQLQLLQTLAVVDSLDEIVDVLTDSEMRKVMAESKIIKSTSDIARIFDEMGVFSQNGYDKRRQFWNDVAEKYNSASVEDLVQVPVKRTYSVSTVRKQLRTRGLEPGVDCEVKRLRKDGAGRLLPRENWPVLVKKISEKFLHLK